VINLREREDRRRAVLEESRDSGLEIEFFIVDKDEENPQRGCYSSHQACAKLALERNYKRTLILEDDCTLKAFSPSTIDRARQLFSGKSEPRYILSRRTARKAVADMAAQYCALPRPGRARLYSFEGWV
jgi:glycosyl transferase family 25